MTFDEVVKRVRTHRADHPRSKIRPPKREEFDAHMRVNAISEAHLLQQLFDFFDGACKREAKVLSGEQTFEQAFNVPSAHQRGQKKVPSVDKELKAGRLKTKGRKKGESWI